MNTDYRARWFSPITCHTVRRSSSLWTLAERELQLQLCGESWEVGLYPNIFSQPSISSASLKTPIELNCQNTAIQFNSAHRRPSPYHHRTWCRFEIRTLADTFQNCYYCCWTARSSHYPDCFGILDIVQIDKAGWVSSQYSKNYATRPMRTDEQTVTGGCRIVRRGGRRATCDRERCSLMPSCAPFSTSCGGFGT